MTLATGTRLGPYEVLSPLGSGGIKYLGPVNVSPARDTSVLFVPAPPL